MATNKRKDAAALFELIDKSTLKVPKNAGSLKIPNWWSSKTNPASAEIAGEELPEIESVPRRATPAPKPVAIKPTTPKPLANEALARGGNGSSVKDAGEAKAVGEVPVQHRLFDPPPAHITPPTSPSIRPPAAGASPSIRPPAPVEPVAAVETGEVVEVVDGVPESLTRVAWETHPNAETQAGVVPVSTEGAREAQEVVATNDNGGATEEAAVEAGVDVPMDAPEAPEMAVAAVVQPLAQPAPVAARNSVMPSMPRVFAPQTHAQDRKPWSPPRPGAFARLPGWVMVSGVAAVVLIIAVAVVMAKSMGKSKAVLATVPTDVVGSSGSLIPPSNGPSMGRSGASAGQVPVSGQRGKVWNPGEFQHTPELYYIIICTTPSQKVAQDDANWFAEHGISVSIEMTQARAGANLMYTLVSGFGLKSATAAEPYRKQIIQVGDLLKKNAFKDAYAMNGLSSPGATRSSQ